MTCGGSGRVPCGECDGAGSRAAPYMPSLGLFTVSLCPSCMGKRASACPGCPECRAAKGEVVKAETDRQGRMF